MKSCWKTPSKWSGFNFKQTNSILCFYLAGHETRDNSSKKGGENSEKLSVLHDNDAGNNSKKAISASQELSKKLLVELAKSDMTTQSVNIHYNELNKLILPEIRRNEWKVNTFKCFPANDILAFCFAGKCTHS